MSEINDGGPAFPVSMHYDSDSYFGMSLRDWFAGMALQSIQKQIFFYEHKQNEEAVKKGQTSWCEIRNNTDACILTEDDETIAYSAYFIADAMLKARKDTL